MKLFRVFLAVIVLLIFICVIAVGCLVFFIDPNKLKPVIAEEMMKQTGYQLVIDGKLTWSFFPRFGVMVERMALSEPQQAAFIELQTVKIAADPWQFMQGNKKLQGHIDVAGITFLNMHIENVHADLHWQNDVLTMQPVTASLYAGSLEGIVHGRQLAKVPDWDWNVQLQHVQLKPLLQDLNGGENKLNIQGTGQIKMQATTTGTTKNQLLSHLNGTSEFSVENGAVEGIDLNYLVQTADALMDKQPLAPPPHLNQTVFNSLTATMAMSAGEVSTNNLLLVSPAFIAKGQGNINLLSEVVNFQLLIKSQQQLKIQWDIPVSMTGNIHHLEAQLDMNELEKTMLREKINNVKDQVREEIKQHIPGKTGEFLQNLLGK